MKFKITEKSVDPVSKIISIIPNNRKKDPNKEYKKNNKDALFLRWRDPNKPIIKKIGIKLASKKKKNNNISRVQNKFNKQNSKKIILFNKKIGNKLCSQLIISNNGVIIETSKIKIIEIPSTP